METNETVEQVCNKMKEPSIYKGRFPASFFDGEFCEFADRILAAHKRELAGLIANLDALERAIETVCDTETIEKIIAKKKEIQSRGVARRARRGGWRGGGEMTDNLCESCDHWKVHWDMHCECKEGVEPPDTYRSCKLGCPKYKNEEKETDNA